MYRLTRRAVMTLLLVGLGASRVYAVVPPSTTTDSAPRVSLHLTEWFIYGSIVGLLCTVFVGAIALLLRLIQELFKT